MPAAKSTYSRYRIIDQCLTSKTKRYWSKKELLTKLAEHDLAINTRTVDYDIECMRYDSRLGYLAPIQYCATNKGYYYTDPAYSIDKLTLNPSQLQSLIFAHATLRQYKGIAMFDVLEEAVEKIVKFAGPHQSQNSNTIVDFEKAPYFKGTEYFDTLLESIHQQKALTIVHTKFSTTISSTHTFHPYFLKENKNRWYVLGFSNERDHVIIMGLDRINSIEQTAHPYRVNTDINLESYFHDAIGVSLGQGPPECILLHCTTAISGYMKTQHLHHSQQIVSEDETGVIIGLELIINYELISLILSYGKDMKVLAPETLQHQIKIAHQQAADLYADDTM